LLLQNKNATQVSEKKSAIKNAGGHFGRIVPFWSYWPFCPRINLSVCYLFSGELFGSASAFLRDLVGFSAERAEAEPNKYRLKAEQGAMLILKKCCREDGKTGRMREEIFAYRILTVFPPSRQNEPKRTKTM
jgi:hypothetical protein